MFNSTSNSQQQQIVSIRMFLEQLESQAAALSARGQYDKVLNAEIDRMRALYAEKSLRKN
jgi:hypothetical protein